MIKKSAIVVFLFALSHISFAQGVFKFDKELYDFGNVDEGEQMEVLFTFTNTGDKPILIKSVQSSCGCTTPFWTKQAVDPGQVGSIKARYDSKNVTGVFNKNITIISNASTPSKQLTIKGNVSVAPNSEPIMTVEQAPITFGKVQQHKPFLYKMSYKNTGKRDLQLLRIQSTCQCIRRSGTLKSIKSNETAILELIYTPKTLGKQQETIYITTNNPKNPLVQIPFSSEVVRELKSQSLLKQNVFDF